MPPNPRRTSAWSAAGRHIGRELEDVATEIDQIEIAEAVFAERCRTVQRAAGIEHQLRGSLGGGPRGAVETQGEDLVVDEVGEEILPLQRFPFAAIDITAGNRMSDGVVIEIDRRDERAGRIKRASARIRGRPLDGIPTVVGTDLAEVDLFPLVLADIGNVKIAERAVEARPPRVAQAKGKYFVGSRHSDEGVVGGHRIVAGGIAGKAVAMHVDTQNLAEQRIDVLPAAQRIAPTAAIAQRGIEISVGSETDPTAFVIAEDGLIDRDDRRGACRVGDVRVRRHVIAADLGVAAGIDQIDVEEAVGGEIRIERKSEQAALAVRQDLVGHVEKRRGLNLVRGKIDDFDLAGFLDDKEATEIAGGRDGEKRLGEIGCNPVRGD